MQNNHITSFILNSYSSVLCFRSGLLLRGEERLLPDGEAEVARLGE